MNVLALLVIALAVGGMTTIVCGIAMLAGVPWACIAAGTAMTVVAAILRRGIAPHG